MCPNKNLKWFKDHGHRASQIHDIRRLAATRWNETYKGDEGPEIAPHAVPWRGKVSVLCFIILSLYNYNFTTAQIKMGCFTGL